MPIACYFIVTALATAAGELALTDVLVVVVMLPVTVVAVVIKELPVLIVLGQNRDVTMDGYLSMRMDSLALCTVLGCRLS